MLTLPPDLEEHKEGIVKPVTQVLIEPAVKLDPVLMAELVPQLKNHFRDLLEAVRDIKVS